MSAHGILLAAAAHPVDDVVAELATTNGKTSVDRNGGTTYTPLLTALDPVHRDRDASTSRTRATSRSTSSLSKRPQSILVAKKPTHNPSSSESNILKRQPQWEDKFNLMQSQYQKDTELLQDKFKKLEASYKDVLKERTALQATLNLKDSDLNDLTRAVSILKGNLEKAEQRNLASQDKANKQTQMQKKIDDHEKQTLKQKAVMDTLRAEHATMEKDRNRARDKEKELKDKLVRMETLEKELNALRLKVIAVEVERDGFKERVSGFKDELKQVELRFEDQKADLVKEHGALQSKVKEMAGEVQSYRGKVMESEHMQEEVRRDVYGLLEAQRQDYEERTKELGEALAETRLVLAERDMDLQHTQEAFELQEEELENTYAYCEHLQSVLECTEHEAEQVLQHIRVYELETKEMLTDHSEQTEWLQHTLVDTQDLAVDQTTLAHYLEHESLHTELVDQHDRDIHQELEWIDAETMYDYELYQDRLRYSTETDNLTDDLDASRNELVEFKKLYGAREAELMKQMERLKEDHERRIKEEHGALLDELAKSKAEIERLKLNEKKQKKEQERVEKEKEDARKLMDVLKRQIDDGETEMTELNQQLQELREQNIEMVDQREQELQYLKLKHAHAYGEVVRLNGENADLLGHKNEKQRIHYVKRIQQDNQKLKKDNLTLMQERDQQKRRAERLEREMEGYRSISINGSAAPPATVRAPARTKSNSVSVTKTPAKRGSVDITAARRTSLLPTDNEL